MDKQAFKNTAAFLGLTALGAALIIYGEEVSSAMTEALQNCFSRIIPSLFAMSVVSSAISKSGFISRFCKKTNPEILSAFIFGNIGGYPIGAKLLKEAVDSNRLPQSEASRAMSFCFGCGPAFAAGIAGAAVFKDIRFGLAALAACILTNLTFFIVYSLKSRDKTEFKPTERRGFSSKLMIESVSSAASAMISVCSMILFFSAIKAVIEAVFPQIKSLKYFSAVLEISNLASLSDCKGVSIAIVAALLGFGGLCVHAQIIGIIDGAFSVKQFYLSRLAAIPLTAFYAFVIEKILFALGIVCETATKIRLSRSPSLIPIICVFAMVFITLLESAKRAK